MGYTVTENVIRFSRLIQEVFPRKWAAAFLLKLEILLILQMKSKIKNMYCTNEALNCLFSKIKLDDAVDR